MHDSELYVKVREKSVETPKSKPCMRNRENTINIEQSGRREGEEG